jgi:mannose-6-phosphate isomerase-like protein (cupin superfamily)
MNPTTRTRPSYNPFQSSVQPEPPAEAEHLLATTQAKPWGHELIWADGTHGYVGKTITVLAGKALSLQLHHHKDETITVLSGEMLFECGPSAEAIEPTTMLAGDTVHVPPRTVHRITAVTDVVLIEASTAEPGWRDDVVRLVDDYGREGTASP